MFYYMVLSRRWDFPYLMRPGGRYHALKITRAIHSRVQISIDMRVSEWNNARAKAN